MGETTYISILYRIGQCTELLSYMQLYTLSFSLPLSSILGCLQRDIRRYPMQRRTRRVTGIDGPDLQVRRQTVRQVPSIQTLLSVPSYRIVDDFSIVEGVDMHFMRSSDEIHLRRCSVDVLRRKSAPLSRSPLNRSRQPDRSFQPTINTIDHRNYWLLSRITFVF
jgi:hypothetical protein